MSALEYRGCRFSGRTAASLIGDNGDVEQIEGNSREGK